MTLGITAFVARFLRNVKRGCLWSMASGRLTVIRGSLILNLILMLYLGFTWLSSPASQVTFRDSEVALLNQRSFEDLSGEAYPAGRRTLGGGGGDRLSNQLVADDDTPYVQTFRQKDGEDVEEDPSGPQAMSQIPESGPQSIPESVLQSQDLPEMLLQNQDPQEPPREVQESQGVTEHLVAAPLGTEVPDPPLNSLERKVYPDFRDCATKPLRPFISQRGDYWIMENYIPAAMAFRCDESITYTTHADYTFLDNLDPLTSRWQGPVSIAVYGPGTDFEASVKTISYLRECWAEGIKKYVTFHLFFHVSHTPKSIPSTEEVLKQKIDCSIEPPKWVNVTTYRQKTKLLYPVNVARNVARLASQTYFVFPSDVELYPSLNFIPEFFKMLKMPDATTSSAPRAYVFSIFEVSDNVSPPETKAELVSLIKEKKAIPFHRKICPVCHQVPKAKEWLDEPIKPGLSVFHIAKRQKPFNRWEPIYVGTNKDPIYDERLSWEGKSDKMTQMYILCVKGYEFHILDNAFLVHKPGIKVYHKDKNRDVLAAKQSKAIRAKILPQYRVIFGSNKNCTL